MAVPTSHLQLLKPSNVENYDVDLFNKNFDKIDKAVAAPDVETISDVYSFFNPNLDNFNFINGELKLFGIHAYFSINFSWKAAKTVGSTGDLSNSPALGGLKDAYLPLFAVGLHSSHPGRGLWGMLATTGGIDVTAASGSSDITANSSHNIGGFYIRNFGA